MPGELEKIRVWFRDYKKPDGVGPASSPPASPLHFLRQRLRIRTRRPSQLAAEPKRRGTREGLPPVT